MKTSKRLLSFFLAVVMVVTTCSVGFTAFAAEKNKSIWSTQCEAEDAYKTLNSLADLLPQLLMGIEAIGNPMYEKYAKSVGKTVDQLTDAEKEEVAANATISDLLGVLQPTLINALAKTSQADHAEAMGSGRNADYYDYLLKDDGSIDFFTLYGLCRNYKDNNELSKESRDTLNAWYEELSKIADIDIDSDVAINKLINMYVKQDSDDAWYKAYLSRLQEFYNADFFAGIDEETIAAVKTVYPSYVKELAGYGFELELDPEAPISETFPVFLYYYNAGNVQGGGWTSVMNTMYISLIALTNTELSFSVNSDDLPMFEIEGALYDYENKLPAGISCPFVYNYTDIKSVSDFIAQSEEQFFPAAQFLFLKSIGVDPTDKNYTESKAYKSLPAGFTDNFYAMVTALLESITPEEALTYSEMYKDMFAVEFENKFSTIVAENLFKTQIADGAAIKYSGEVTSIDDINDLIAAKMPDRELTDDEIKELGSLIYSAQADAAEYFGSGSVETVDTMGYPFSATILDIVKDTAVADLFAEIIEKSSETSGTIAPIVHYYRELRQAFYSRQNDFSSTHFLTEDGTPVTPLQVTSQNLTIQRYEGGLPKLNYGEASFDRAKIDSYLEDAAEYGHAHIIADLLGIGLDENSNGISEDIRLHELNAYIIEQNDVKITVELTDEQKAILYGDYDLTGKLGTELVNTILNNTVGGIVENNIVKGLLTSLLGGVDVDLAAALMDIWARLNDDAVKTIFELVPLLVTVVDSLLVPVLFNNDGTKYDNFLGNVLSSIETIDLSSLMAANGSYIGVSKFSFNLNNLLPDLMHWLFDGAEAEGIEYYSGDTVARTNKAGEVILTPAANVNTADVRNYTVKDQNGNILSRVDDENGTTFTYLGVTDKSMDVVLKGHEDSVFTYETTYSSDVPYLTGIYIADKALKDADINDLPKLLGEALGDKQLGTALSEVIYEIATLFTVAVDDFVASDRMDQAKFEAGGDLVSTGLNLIFTAIPQLFDIMEDLAAEKYGIAKDNWTYCYEGKIDTSDVVYINDHAYNKATNSRIKEFNVLAGSDDPDRSVDVLDLFAEILVEDWLNAIVSLVNGVIATDNKISKNLPIIAGLLNALGGFGEQSIITDIVNSVFQIDRDNEYSFTFTEHENGLTGLSKENAYFLITNVERLVEVVKNLIAHFNSGDNNNPETPGENPPAQDNSPAVKPKAAKPAKATSANYSSSDLSNAKDLIGNLDKMLSSLLSDSTLNGFSLSSTENLIAGLVSLLDGFLGRDIKLDKDVTTNIVNLVNTYLYFITGKSENLTANGKKVDAKKVYTNNALTGLVVETYALIEQLADSLLVDFYDTYDNDASLKYNLLVEAIDGVISPDAVGIRLGDYTDAQEAFAKYDSWSTMAKDSSRNDYKKLGIDWGFKNGDKDGFYDGLAASLRLVTSILGVLLIDTGWYNTVLTPVLAMFCTKNGVKVESYKALVADKNATGYYDKTLIAILTSVSGWLDALLKAPASTLIKTVQGVAGFLDEKNTKAGTIKSVINGVMAPITRELKGLGNIFAITADNGLLATSPTLKTIIDGLADTVSGLINADKIKLGNEPYTYTLNGNNIIPIINSYIAGTGITLKQISWSKIYSSTPEAALVYVLEYAIETLLENENLAVLLEAIMKGTGENNGEDNGEIIAIILDALKTSKLDAKKLLALINRVLEVSDSPTLAYWTFASYLQELTESFKYPAGITKAMANQGVDALDNLVANIFPLLGSFGVDLGADDLQGILNSKLFTNELLTTIATALYGALDGLDPTIKSVLASLGVVSSTKDVAKILTDTSYGKTFSSAANTIKAQSNWKNVKNINWGFTNGSGKAQQGFVNALVAILRPLNNVLNVFLNEGSLQLNNVVYDLICSLEVAQTSTELKIDGNMVAKITYSMKGGIFTVKIDDTARELSKASTLKLDLRSLKNLKDLKIVGTNGYNSAIIPLLEAFKCSGIKTYSQYRSDVKSAKDNLLLDVLNPILGASDNSLLNKLAAKPFATLTELLPNIAMYLDAHGLSQLINNLLAPVTSLISYAAKTLNIDAVLEDFLGTDLSGLVSALLGVDVNLDLTNLSTLNIEDLIIPIVRMVLAGNDNEAVRNLKLYDIDWNALISLGTKSAYTSKATGADGNYLTGKTLTGVDNGKVLITVLRYIAKTLISNMSTIKGLVLGIDAVKKNDIISSIVSSVFNTLSTASEDQLIAAIFYLVSSSPSNAFWDYTKYKTGEYDFTYPEGINTEFLKSLPPMLDGLIGGLADLNELISKALFKDDIISSLVTGLYGAVEGVKVGDGTLTALLAQTDIDFSTANVANLLVDESYGQKFEGPAAVIKAAGSWANVDKASLKWGVTDRDSFFHALVAALRPLYGVLDVLLNDAYLGLFDLVRIPGSNGYTSSIVPLMEAFSMYNIKTQYQYREDIIKEYDAILLDIINPIWDKVEDILKAPLQTVAAVIPNLALFLGNDGLCQILDNLLTPISALADAIRPIVDLNDLLNTLFKALDFDLNSLLAKIGVTNFSLDVYDLNKTLKPLVSADALIPLINSILGIIKIKGTPLGLKLNDVDWLKLASHGTTVVSYSQAATYGSRVFVEGDSSETLIAVLRYLIDTVNTGDNFDKIADLVGGLLGDGVADNVSKIINQVLGMLKGDTDTVIGKLVGLLETLS